MDPSCIPFSFPTVYQGLAKGGGLVIATTSALTLEFQVKDGFFGVLKSGVQRIEIPLNELNSVDLKQGWFRNRLLIKVKSMTTLANVPGSETGQVELRVARRDASSARSLVSLLMLRLSERKLAELDRAHLNEQ